MVAAVVEERSSEQDPVAGWLRDVLAGIGAELDICRVGESAEGAALVDQIALAEQITSALAAFKAAKMVRFREHQIAAQQAEGWDPAQVGRGIADQIGLACHVSPSEGSRRLGRAWTLWHELPATFDLMAEGRLSEWAAQQVVTETRHLDSTTRRVVDRALVEEDRIDTLGVRAVIVRARTRAYRADPDGYTERGKTERKHRRVSIRPAPDTMSWLSGYLPVEQGVACFAALHRATDAAKAFGDPRSRDQIMADTLVERLTGQQRADAVPLQVWLTDAPDNPLDDDPGTPPDEGGPGGPPDDHPQPNPRGSDGAACAPDGSACPPGSSACPPGTDGAPGPAGAGGTTEPDGFMLPDVALKRLHDQAREPLGVKILVPWVTLHGGEWPGVLVGHEPIPAPLVRELIATADGALSFSVLRPDTGRASPSRTFRGQLKQSIELRDQRCRDPFCGSPIRHFDHIRRWSDGGPTSYANGRGVCERGNYIRELPGWTVRLIDPDTHTIEITTPTGHTYTSQPPRPP